MGQHFSTDSTGNFARLYIFFPPDPMKCYCIKVPLERYVSLREVQEPSKKLVSTLSSDNLL